MSRPRTPFGTERPGRMAATAIRVLAAEMSDPGRFARGKRYWSDRAVTDIVVGPGVVTTDVLGSHREPYVVTLTTRPGRGVPPRREVTVRCTCLDDGRGGGACKHAVASLLTLGDELSIEPELLARWRCTDTVPADDHDDHDDHDDQEEPEEEPDDVTGPHPFAAMVRFPDGATLPPIPELGPAAHPRLPDPAVGAVLDDARDALQVRWD